MGRRGANAVDQLGQLEWFGQVVERADAMGERGRLDRAAGGHEDDAPPCQRAISATSERPRPRPVVPAAEAPRKKRSKMRARSAAAIPGPRSSIFSTAASPSRSTRTTTGADVYLSALPTRLSMTRS